MKIGGKFFRAELCCHRAFALDERARRAAQGGELCSGGAVEQSPVADAGPRGEANLPPAHLQLHGADGQRRGVAIVNGYDHAHGRASVVRQHGGER